MFSRGARAEQDRPYGQAQANCTAGVRRCCIGGRRHAWRLSAHVPRPPTRLRWLENFLGLLWSWAMSRRSFLEQETRSRASDVIREIESRTAVEVVVAVRKSAARYVQSHLLWGALAAILVLAWLLFSPTVYPLLLIPVDTAAAFVFGVVLCALIPGCKMLFVSRRARDEAVERGARALFDELGIANTRDRSGLLVYVALLERRVVLLPDSGIRLEVLGPEYAQAEHGMQAALREYDDQAFLSALVSLRDPLGQAMPRRADDVNELSDDVA